MNRETRASVSVIIATAIILTLPLLVVGNPVLFIINAESASATGDSLTVSRSTTLNPLGDTVLSLNDGTNVLKSQSDSGLSPEGSSTTNKF